MIGEIEVARCPAVIAALAPAEANRMAPEIGIHAKRAGCGCARARLDSYNKFQGRYIIRHTWTGPIGCDNPRRGIWGGPPSGNEIAQSAPKAATNIAFAPRGNVQLANLVAQDVPELDVKGTPLPGRASFSSKPRSCGCQADDPGALAGGALLAGVWLVVTRRRRRPAGA